VDWVLAGMWSDTPPSTGSGQALRGAMCRLTTDGSRILEGRLFGGFLAAPGGRRGSGAFDGEEPP